MLRLLTILALLVFAPAAWAQASYQIQPGDVLQVEVLEDPSLNRSALVLPDGSISFPLIGTLEAGGRTVEDVRGALVQELGPNFAAPPTVFVSVASLAQPEAEALLPTEKPSISVYGIGELAAPGKHEVEPGTTLLQFLAESGGFSRFAATKRVQLRRTDPVSGREQVYQFNYEAVERGSRRIGEIILTDGDVVVVPERRLFE